MHVSCPLAIEICILPKASQFPRGNNKALGFDWIMRYAIQLIRSKSIIHKSDINCFISEIQNEESGWAGGYREVGRREGGRNSNVFRMKSLLQYLNHHVRNK